MDFGLLFLFALLAQAVPPPTPDWALEGANLITLMAPALVRIALWGSFFVVERIPVWAAPLAAVVLAIGYDALNGLLWTDPILVAFKTVGMLILREVIDKYFMKASGIKGKLVTVSEVPSGKRFFRPTPGGALTA